MIEEEQELERWIRMVSDLRKLLTIEDFAEKVNVTPRTVCNWQSGERPMGLAAIRVYLLHVELCSEVHRSPLHSQAD
jgi:transcriptional regulator with XRE-family HTH domain